MAEPIAEEFPRYLGDEYLVDHALEAEIRRAYDEAQTLAKMFTTRGWKIMERKLREWEADDQRALETCEVEKVQRHRDRLGYWRWMLSQPAIIAVEVENLRTRLAEFVPPENEEG